MNPILCHLRAVEAQKRQADELKRLMDGASGGRPEAPYGWAPRMLHVNDDGSARDGCSHAPRGWANTTLHLGADGTVREYVSYLDARRN